MLVELTLLILAFITVFSMMFGNALTGYQFDDVVNQDLIVNGTTTTLEFNASGDFLSVDPIIGATVIIITIMVIAGALGIQILGSGLSDSSQKAIVYSIFYIGIWTILSLLSYPLISAIDIFGLMIYTLLTLAYAVGVVQKFLQNGNGG